MSCKTKPSKVREFLFVRFPSLYCALHRLHESPEAVQAIRKSLFDDIRPIIDEAASWVGDREVLLGLIWEDLSKIARHFHHGFKILPAKDIPLRLLGPYPLQPSIFAPATAWLSIIVSADPASETRAIMSFCGVAEDVEESFHKAVEKFYQSWIHKAVS